MTLEEFNGSPVAIRLTQPTVIAGMMLPPGSIMRQTGNNKCSLFPAEIVVLGNVQIPAASEIELMSGTGGYQWTGIVILGDAVSYQGLPLIAGDGAFFTGPLLSDPILAQVRMGAQRELAGQWYPAGTVVYIDAAGTVTGINAPIPPDALVVQQESYRNQKAAKENSCKEICAQHKEDVAAHTSCMEYCLSR